MDIFDALKTRRAIREYTEESVDGTVLEAVIDAATSAPSAMNQQPWTFAVIQGSARLHELSLRVKPYALQHLPAHSPLIAHLTEDPHFEIFHWAPALIIVCARHADTQAVEDCCLAAQNLMLAAHAKGLGTCWIGLSQPWLNQAAIKSELGIAAELTVVAPIIIGHPRRQPLPTPREKARIIWCK